MTNGTMSNVASVNDRFASGSDRPSARIAAYDSSMIPGMTSNAAAYQRFAARR
jgi:hypothetical protein